MQRVPNRQALDRLADIRTCLFMVLILCGCVTEMPVPVTPPAAMPPEQTVSGREYVVSIGGDDANPGTADAPFRTINHAAQVAMPGDTITVREGVYREWVRPKRGGTSENARIVYRAAPGEDVRILGSEPAKGWRRAGGNVWELKLDESRFDGFNPFATLSRNPQYIKEDEEGDGWGWLKYGRWTHLGDVYIDGEGFTEKEQLDEVGTSMLSWHARTADGVTTILANFGGRDPNVHEVEINHRPYAFFPETAGLGYITVRGFTIQNVASHWAPPIAFQPGAVGVNGGHHWVIEDNIVLYAKAVCISIGNPNGPANREDSGHHVIRNNVLMRCGQAGTAGDGWAHHSHIRGNHIEDINYREEFGGWETAGIKHHRSAGVHIENNFIRNVHTADPAIGSAHGIWNDYQNTNWRISGNVVIGVEGFALLTEANWNGPNLNSNNIFAGGGIGVYSARGDAWLHNLFLRTPQQWENQPWGGRPAIGNSRWHNNLFVGHGMFSGIKTRDSVFSHNVYVDGARAHAQDTHAVVRTGASARAEIVKMNDGVRLELDVDRSVSEAMFPIVGDKSLGLNFAKDATVDTDFFGKRRDRNSNAAGPFAALKAGRNDFVIYEYPPLYRKALDLIGKETER